MFTDIYYIFAFLYILSFIWQARKIQAGCVYYKHFWLFRFLQARMFENTANYFYVWYKKYQYFSVEEKKDTWSYACMCVRSVTCIYTQLR